MPLRLNVGISRKVGLPAYSSIGASCHLEVELENGILRDPAGFGDQVRGTFAAARRAVDDELARLQGEVNPAGDHAPIALGRPSGGDRPIAGVGPPSPSPSPRPQLHHQPRHGKPATPNQVRAIVTIARRNHADLDGLLGDLGVDRPEELSLAAASALIDQLKAAAS